MFAAAAAVESGPTSYDISNDCNRFGLRCSVRAFHSPSDSRHAPQCRRVQRQREQRKREEAGEPLRRRPLAAFTHILPQHAVWSKKEILLPMLKRQVTTNPDDVFGKCPTSVDLAAVFHKEKPRKRRYSQVGALGCLPRAFVALIRT